MLRPTSQLNFRNALLAALCKTPRMKQDALEAVHDTCKRFWRFDDGIQAAYDAGRKH